MASVGRNVQVLGRGQRIWDDTERAHFKPHAMLLNCPPRRGNIGLR
jgi:hypothetical protein